MAKLSDLSSRVLDEFPSAPRAFALRALSDAAKEFCSRTHVWQAQITPITLRPGQTEYEIDLDTGTQLVAFKDVRLDGKKIDPIATELFRLRTDNLRAGLPLGFIQWQPSTIELINPPKDASVLDVTAALTLALNATDVDLPDSIIDEYGESLASGAKGRLARQRGQAWSDPEAVVGYMGPFYADVAKAKARVNTALGSAQVQVEMRRW